MNLNYESDTDDREENWRRPFPDYLKSPPERGRFSNAHQKSNTFFIVISIALVVVYSIWIFTREKLGLSDGVLLGLWLLGLLAIPILRVASHHAARDSLLATPDDPRQLIGRIKDPPALLLRPFAIDKKIPGKWTELTPVTMENMLVETCHRLDSGLIALGRPRSMVSGRGAARFFVADDLWQKGITDLMSRCCIVFILLGDTANIKWELRALYDRPADKHLVFFILPVSEYLSPANRGTALDDWETLGPWRKLMPPVISDSRNTRLLLIAEKKHVFQESIKNLDADLCFHAIEKMLLRASKEVYSLSEQTRTENKCE